ncbi:Hydrogen cyanide synthase subunit HcnC precursor [Corynebacterium atrinae]|uniref:glycine oxidase ThiO n=1 Tax=Corynebacterium atrinae TaxID=1336740 RepID=UPI0025B551F3|nr:glycine oxidase ThiO [Corynebacterium atrinae]WJY63715.1 Hydrogen cyanide synthase subunit HcnC precursor [Corynebacterium atrinae]
MTHISVIGGGLIGLATAFRLGLRGHRVVLFDPTPARGATHHAGGMLAPTAEVVYRQEALFPLMRASAGMYPELIADVEKHSTMPTGYRTEGTIVVAADRADATHLTELADYQSMHGMTVERLSVRQARALETALHPRLAGAVSIPDDHQVAPRTLAAALLDALGNVGVDLIREEVHRLPTEGQVILSNGLDAARLVEGLRLRPVYGDIVRLRVPDHLTPPVTQVVRGVVEGRPVYVIPRADRTIAIGATSREDGRHVPQVSGVHDLLRDAIRLVPALEECDFLGASCGARPGTPDDLPYLGRVSDRLIVSTGYFRHGILLTALAAQAAVDLIEGNEPAVDLSACLPTRFQEHP